MVTLKAVEQRMVALRGLDLKMGSLRFELASGFEDGGTEV